jgi:hypothetical protein
MCFSATASFSAAAVCGAIGALTVRRASRPDLMLAFIPVIFALHQALEGFVWLTSAEGWWGRCAGYDFAIIAFCLWPIYVPVAAWLSETDPRRRRFMLGFLVLGAVVVAGAAWVLHAGLTIDFASNQIRYLPAKRYPLIFDYIYAAAVTGPLLLHRNNYLRVFGCLILVFFGASILLFNPARYSVWCFFAAISSIVLYLFVASRSVAARDHSGDEQGAPLASALDTRSP